MGSTPHARGARSACDPRASTVDPCRAVDERQHADCAAALPPRWRGAYPHLLAHVTVRHRVQAPVELDVGVDVHLGLLSLGELEVVAQQREQRRSLERLEHLGAALAVGAHAPAIQVIDALTHGGVEVGERVEDAVAQATEDPALNDSHGSLGSRARGHLDRDRGHPDRRYVDTQFAGTWMLNA
jgi:hypothetical protein